MQNTIDIQINFIDTLKVTNSQIKITVAIQGRTHEYQAVTSGPELATGTEVRVVKQITENTFEVEAL